MSIYKFQRKADKFLNKKQYSKAIPLYIDILKSNSRIHEAHYGLAACYISSQDVSHLDDAIYHVTEALKLHPTAQYLDCAVLAFIYKGMPDVAIRYQKQALRLEPTADNQFKLSDTYKKIGDYINAEVEAKKLLDTSMAETLQVPTHIASILLTAGKYREGWQFWEWRRNIKTYYRVYDGVPYWDGIQDLNNKVLFLYGEQGFGDIIQFSRFILSLKEKYPNLYIIYESSKPLAKLFYQYPFDKMVVKKRHDEHIDYHCSLLSLGGYLDITIDTIPYVHGYLSSPAMILPPTHKKRVGIAWHGQSSDKTQVDVRRNICLKDLAELFNIPNIEWYTLQVDGNEECAEYGIVDATSNFNCFADTAELIMSLDAVVTVDTAVAHLAGALNKKVYVLSRIDGCWRWGYASSNALWYSSAVVIRQKDWFCWKAAILELRLILNNLGDFLCI